MINKKLVTFVFFLTVGLAVAAVGYADITGQTDFTKSHTQVDAEITDITYETQIIQTGVRTTENTGISHHKPKVEYTYSYDGKSRTQELRLSAHTGSIESAKQAVSEEYNIGDTKTIYVSEGSPEDVRQNEPSEFSSYILTISGLLLSLSTVLLANRSRKS